MPPSPNNPGHAALIVGCGFVGRVLASQLIQRGHRVYATTRSQDRVTALAQLGARPLIMDVTQPITLTALRPVAESPLLDVYFLLPPGRMDGDPSPREVVIDGAERVINTLKKATIRRAVFASSTAVYGQTGGVRVDADTAPLPADARARLLIDAELAWLAHGPMFHVVRFAGLYGPGRVVGAQAVLDGAPIVGDPDAMLNLLHVEDAAGLLLAIADHPSPCRVELGCDNRPVARVEYYRHLAGKLGAPSPAVLDNTEAARRLGLNIDRLRRASSKACDNALTRRRTGWSPRFADYVAGLEDAIPQQA